MDTPEEPEFDELAGEEGKEAESSEEEPYPQSYPIRANIVITKVIKCCIEKWYPVDSTPSLH
jgi:hypothetical protein